MRILAIETSAGAVSAAITEEGRILASGYQDTGLTHSRTLMPMVESLFQNADIAPASLDAVAVSVGPGSFTGIRIGVAAAKGLALGLDIPCAAVSTLAALARHTAPCGGLLVCAMDARRGQVYNALFDAGDGGAERETRLEYGTPSAQDGAPRRLTEDRAIALSDLAAELRPIAGDGAQTRPITIAGDGAEPRPITITGDGAELCLAFLQEQGVPCRIAPPQLVRQNAVGVALEAERIAAEGKLVHPRNLRPFYLRPPYALTLKQRQAGMREPG